MLKTTTLKSIHHTFCNIVITIHKTTKYNEKIIIINRCHDHSAIV